MAEDMKHSFTPGPWRYTGEHDNDFIIWGPGESKGRTGVRRMDFAQIAIAMTGVTAVFLSQSKREDLRRFACIFGLIGQPFWFIATWQAEQWGIFALCFLYTFSWARGAWNFWIVPHLLQKAGGP